MRLCLVLKHQDKRQFSFFCPLFSLLVLSPCSCCHLILTRAHFAWLKSDLKRSHVCTMHFWRPRYAGFPGLRQLWKRLPSSCALSPRIGTTLLAVSRAACGFSGASFLIHCVLATGFHSTAPIPYWIVICSTCGVADVATVPVDGPDSAEGQCGSFWTFSATQALDRSWCWLRVDLRGSLCSVSSRLPLARAVILVVLAAAPPGSQGCQWISCPLPRYRRSSHFRWRLGVSLRWSVLSVSRSVRIVLGVLYCLVVEAQLVLASSGYVWISRELHAVHWYVQFYGCVWLD